MSKKLVIIDAGHGGKDSGAVGNGLKEANEVLKDAKTLKQYILSNYDNVDVYMMRDSNLFIGINARREKSNQLARKYGINNVAFVSLHLNSFNRSSANGWEIWANYPDTKGHNLAKSIHTEFKKTSVLLSDRGIKFAKGNLGVLRANPATVLVESCFISNSNDVYIYKRDRNKLLQAYVRGIAKYLNLERKEVKKKEHWAKKHFDNLNKKGISIEQERFDENITRGEVLALLDKVTDIKK